MVLYLLFLLAFVIAVSRFLSTSSASKHRLPPGPKPWPIIGNIPHLGKQVHVSLQRFSQLYGPLISLRLGSQLVVIASSPAAAAEILRTHDRLLSARYVATVVPYDTVELDRKAIVWASNCNNDRWKAFRAMFRNQMFSARAIESQAAVRERKVARMVEFLQGKLGEPVKIAELAFAAIFDSLSNLMFSRDCIGFESSSETANRLKSLIWRMMELGTKTNFADYFPVLKKLDPQGLRREMFRLCNELYSVWQPEVKERRERGRPGGAEDFLDIFFENGLDDDQIDWLSLELFSAGTDTSMATIEWAMAELIRNKGAMDELRDELKTKLSPPLDGKPALIDESVVAQLPYLSAIVKETLRLHPPAPLLLPHRAPETCKVMNYTVPEGTHIVVNVWAISRDPKVWEDDPMSFKPERFIGSSVDFRGQDFEFLPFSAGRRMCPGVSLATRQIPLVLAALVRSFDWSLSDGEDPTELDMSEKFGTTLEKERPLLLVPNRSSL
ncbi:unnamed protein product [Linum tenue]|uniref:Cytochrome P450 n=1 Tax=Linum tenue TaxID=586396 RepID=A0AAV0N9W1_9ROSI|nr:unnamed protein product [Linum tenue]CAI0455306.1 unnamed protein product [Linum tenue]CAI0456026.1 unnamed protein product [Linum tenue]